MNDDPMTCYDGPRKVPVPCAYTCPDGWFIDSDKACYPGKGIQCRKRCKYNFPGEPEPNPYTEDSVDGNYTILNKKPPNPPDLPINKNNALYGFVYGNTGGPDKCPPGYNFIGRCGVDMDCHNYTNTNLNDLLGRFRICQRDWESLDVNTDDCCAGTNNKQFTTGDCRPFAVPSSNYCLRKMAAYIDENPATDTLWIPGKEDTVNSYINYTANPSAQMKTNQHLLISQLIKEKGGYGFKTLSQGALKNMVSICNQFPGACDQALDQYCSIFDRETLSKYATSADPKKNYIAQLCGCHLPTKEYLGYKQVLAGESPECDPICMNVINDSGGNAGASCSGPSQQFYNMQFYISSDASNKYYLCATDKVGVTQFFQQIGACKSYPMVVTLHYPDTYDKRTFYIRDENTGKYLDTQTGVPTYDSSNLSSSSLFHYDNIWNTLKGDGRTSVIGIPQASIGPPPYYWSETPNVRLANVSFTPIGGGTTGCGPPMIGPSVPRGYETVNNSVTPPTSRWTTKQCNQAICIIDGANINMNTNIGGDINFTNICDRSSGGASGPSGGGPIPISSQCVFSSAGITDAQLTAMSTVDFTKTCKGECYVMVRGKKTPVDCVGSEVVKELRAAGGGGSGGGSGGGGGDDGGGGGTLKKWSFMWIISIALLVLFLFLAIGLTFFAPKS